MAGRDASFTTVIFHQLLKHGVFFIYLFKIIPPYNYKAFVLRKRPNEENVMHFPNALVIQIAGLSSKLNLLKSVFTVHILTLNFHVVL